MADAFTEVTTENLGSRIKDSCAGICVGMLLFFGAFPVLFWNEGRAVARYDALEEGQRNTINITAFDIDSGNEGALVHFNADLEAVPANQSLTDPVFGVSTYDLKFRRTVEMYQWEEDSRKSTRTNAGGKKVTTTTYTYDPTWSQTLIDSNQFRDDSARINHQNPSSMPYQSLTLEQDSIMAGDFELPDSMEDQITWYTDLMVGDTSTFSGGSTQNKTTVLPSGDGLYIGASSQNPAIGDIRVTFDSVQPDEVSIIAVQSGNSLAPYEAESGSSIFLFYQGSYTAAEMYAAEEAANAATTWILRLVGFGLMAGGIFLVFKPIAVFADVIPCLGDCISCGIMFVAAVVAGILSGITISLAWLIHHPLIGGMVLLGFLVVGGGIFACVKRSKNKNDDGNGNNTMGGGGTTMGGVPPGKEDPHEYDPEQGNTNHYDNNNTGATAPPYTTDLSNNNAMEGAQQPMYEAETTPYVQATPYGQAAPYVQAEPAVYVPGGASK